MYELRLCFSGDTRADGHFTRLVPLAWRKGAAQEFAVDFGEGEGFFIGLKISYVVPVEIGLSGTEQRHQFAFNGQEVVEAHKDIRPSGYLGLQFLVVPMLDDGTLSKTAIPLLFCRHFRAQGRV